MEKLTFTVIEISPLIGYHIIRVLVGSNTLNIITGDSFNLAVTDEIAANNEVGTELKL